MKPEEQRIAIAEWCGWSGIVAQPYLQGYRPNHTGIKSLVPDYLNDLNAMHEAENRLEVGFDGSQADDYQQTLYSIVNPGRDFITDFDSGADVGFLHNLIHATASQRAEALLRTIGKWKEEAA